ncbi:hypothetical protein [Dactylosporangium sp. NPDC049140]|uniref:hypothetical protein n=1 Tax=Dactylosporangium sp. NPDC049140 TaxID=3155647 RepID=UPI0033CEC332
MSFSEDAARLEAVAASFTACAVPARFVTLAAMTCVPAAASVTERLISPVVAVRSSTAEAMVFW